MGRAKIEGQFIKNEKRSNSKIRSFVRALGAEIFGYVQTDS